MAITQINNYTYQDGFGNTYFNKKSADLSSSFNAFSGTMFGASNPNTEVNTAITTAYGVRASTTAIANMITVIFNHPNENLTGTANGTNNRRFNINKYASTSIVVSSLSDINVSSNSASALMASNSLSSTSFAGSSGSTIYNFATMNQYSINQWTYDMSIPKMRFNSTGWLYQILPSFESNITQHRYAGCYSIYSETNLSTLATVQGGYHTRNVNQINDIYDLVTTDYSISCADGQTPGSDLWVTNLLLRENALNNNYCIGIVSSNVLLGKGSSFELGKLYRINNVGENTNVSSSPNANPNTDCPHFLCVGNWGPNKLLMRVFAEFYN